MNLGDHVRLKRDIALWMTARNRRPRRVNWETRQGVIHHFRKDQRTVEIQWSDRGSVEPWPLYALEPVN